MKSDSAFSSVVLPDPVPPDTTTLRRCSTQIFKKSAMSWLIVPMSTSRSMSNRFFENFRIVRTGPTKRKRRNNGVDARAVREPRVDHRCAFIDTPPERGDDAFDHAH